MSKKLIKEQFFTVEKIDEFEFSEIDMDLYEEVFPEIKGLDDWPDRTMLGHKHFCGYPLNIDRMIEKLQEFKSKGANYVALEYHEDHIGYQMEALKINPSSENDIKLHNEKNAKKKELDKKRTDLYRQIKKLNDDESKLT